MPNHCYILWQRFRRLLLPNNITFKCYIFVDTARVHWQVDRQREAMVRLQSTIDIHFHLRTNTAKHHSTSRGTNRVVERWIKWKRNREKERVRERKERERETEWWTGNIVGEQARYYSRTTLTHTNNHRVRQVDFVFVRTHHTHTKYTHKHTFATDSLVHLGGFFVCSSSERARNCMSFVESLCLCVSDLTVIALSLLARTPIVLKLSTSTVVIVIQSISVVSALPKLKIFVRNIKYIKYKI